jgi:ABC-2 type transport system permease protein
MEIINNVTMLSIILTGAALIREREHGTIEHLLVMPVTPGEIMLAKVWSMGLVVLLAALWRWCSWCRALLHRADQGSVALFMAGAALHLFATTSMGIFLATRGALDAAVRHAAGADLLPLQMLSGGARRARACRNVQNMMLAAPTTHFVEVPARPSCTAAPASTWCGRSLLAIWPLAACCSPCRWPVFARPSARWDHRGRNRQH